jgi:hypothetical protein
MVQSTLRLMVATVAKSVLGLLFRQAAALIQVIDANSSDRDRHTQYDYAVCPFSHMSHQLRGGHGFDGDFPWRHLAAHRGVAPAKDLWSSFQNKENLISDDCDDFGVEEVARSEQMSFSCFPDVNELGKLLVRAKLRFMLFTHARDF